MTPSLYCNSDCNTTVSDCNTAVSDCNTTVERPTFLRDISEKDSKWDVHKENAMRLADLLEKYYPDEFARQVERLRATAALLGFAWEDEPDGRRLRLYTAWFSKWRHDPVTAWRRALKWRHRWFKAIPFILDQYPSYIWLSLTLTWRNCDVSGLKSSIQAANRAFRKFLKRKEFTSFESMGYCKAVEVTYSKNEVGNAHPHFHIILMLPSSYCKGGTYITHGRFVEMWRSCMKVDYDPSITVKRIKPKKGVEFYGPNNINPAMTSAILEVAKYPVKSADLLQDPEWTREYIQQVHRMRFVEIGGALKPFFVDEDEQDDLIHIDDDDDSDLEDEAKSNLLYFHYLRRWRAYAASKD